MNGRFVEEHYHEDEPDLDDELRAAVSSTRLAGVVVLVIIAAIAGGIAIAIAVARTPAAA